MSLPRQKNPAFTGREDVLQRIESHFWPSGGKEKGSPRKKVSLFGLAGAGKSEVALQYAYRAGERYKAVFWIRAQDATELETSASQAMLWIIDHYAKTWHQSPGHYQVIATELGVFDSKIDSHEDLRKAVTANGTKNIDRFNRWLPTNADWLMVLDNYDDPKACNINAILPNTGVGHVLITSNNSGADISDEMIEIPPSLGMSESLNLLMKESGRIAECCGGGCQHAEEIVESVRSLPLAITMIGAFLRERKVTFKSYKKQLSKKPEITGPLSSIWRASFRLLGQNAKELMQLCSLLHGSYIPERLLEGGKGIVSWMTGMSMAEAKQPFATYLPKTIDQGC